MKLLSATVSPVWYLAAVLAGSLAGVGGCTPPEVGACEDFVSAARACAEMNGDPLAALDNLCDDVLPECREYYTCAAAAECKESGGVYRLESKACTMPEDSPCLPSN